MKRKNEALKAMLKRLKEYPHLLNHYKGDFFTHDKNSILRGEDDFNYLWIVRESGTDLLDLNNDYKDNFGEFISEFYVNYRSKENPESLYFFINSKSIRISGLYTYPMSSLTTYNKLKLSR